MRRAAAVAGAAATGTAAGQGVLNDEPEAPRFEERIVRVAACRISAANLLEAAIVLESRGGPAAGAELDRFLERARVEVVSVSVKQFASARYAWRRFGKGTTGRG